MSLDISDVRIKCIGLLQSLGLPVQSVKSSAETPRLKLEDLIRQINEWESIYIGQFADMLREVETVTHPAFLPSLRFSLRPYWSHIIIRALEVANLIAETPDLDPDQSLTQELLQKLSTIQELVDRTSEEAQQEMIPKHQDYTAQKAQVYRFQTGVLRKITSEISRLEKRGIRYRHVDSRREPKAAYLSKLLELMKANKSSWESHSCLKDFIIENHAEVMGAVRDKCPQHHDFKTNIMGGKGGYETGFSCKVAVLIEQISSDPSITKTLADINLAAPIVQIRSS